MVIIYVISIKNVLLTSELSDSQSAKQFFTNIISKIVVKNIVIDFSEVTEMNISFALQYLKSKQDMSSKQKVIKEICVPKSVCQIIQMTEKEIENSNLTSLFNKKIIQKQLPI